MTDTHSIEQRMIELETKVAFQEHLIDELNGVVTSQQEQIDRIESDLRLAHKELKSLLSSVTGDSDGI